MAPKQKATPAQRRAVCKLMDAGCTYKDCAEIVFGSRRFYGRVERILAQRKRLRAMPEEEFWKQFAAETAKLEAMAPPAPVSRNA